MTALVGLHMRTDGGNSDPDFLAFSTARCEAAKLMTTHDASDANRLRSLGATLIVCRIYENLNGRVVSARDFANWQISQDTSMRRMYANGVRYFELHNEVNLRQEGMWQSWSNGREFGNWYLEVQNILRSAFPEAKFGFPGLSPGGDIFGIRYDATRFWNEAKFALEQADWLGAHAYEVFNTTDRNAGGAWRIVRDLVPNKPIAITEFSSPLQSPTTQAKQYRAYYEKLRNERNLLAAFSFAVSGTHFQNEAWRTESGQLTPIPSEVAKRNFSSLPQLPSMPTQPLYTSRVDRNGANLRNFDGSFFKYVSPNVELAVYTEPTTIGGWPNRVIVNRDTGYNILADRLPRPPVVILGFDSPVGTPDERASLTLWPGTWTSAWHPSTGYTKRYTDSAGNVSYHTGDDLNNNLPVWNSDAHSPVYASADGVVLFAGRVGNYWRNIITVQHADGIYTRYAHVENMLVKAGDRVQRGQQICQVGMSGGTGGNYHLHFDVCVTNVLVGNPGHWPGSDLNGVRANYVDPKEFIRNRRPK